MCPESFAGLRFDLGPLLQGQLWFFIPIVCPESFAGLRFDLGPLLQGQMWFFIPIMAYISLVIGCRGFGGKDDLWEIICPGGHI